jgi:DNA polymerase III delta subunit
MMIASCRRRRLRECAPEYLRVLVVALQNELSSCRSILQQLSLQSHPLAPIIAHEQLLPVDGDEAKVDVDELYERIMEGQSNSLTDNFS